MSIKRFLLLPLFIFVLVNPVHAANVISSTFDDSNEGWIGIPGEGSVAFFPSGGNPGGHIRVTDIGAGGELGSGAIAPSKFLGNLSGFDKGTLHVDLATFAGGGSVWDVFGTVRISGAGDTALFDLTDTAPPYGSWQTLSAPLTAAAWGKTSLEWMTILASVTEIAISTDAFNGNDTIGIDNFTIAAPLDCLKGGRGFESGSGATYLKVCVGDDGTIETFESPKGFQQLATGDNHEGYALCSGSVKVHGFDAGQDGAGFSDPTITQPGGPGTFPLTIVRNTTDGVFQLNQSYARDRGKKDFTVTMTVKNLSASPVTKVKIARYFNGDIDNSAGDDLYDRTVDTVLGTQGPAGHGLNLYALSAGTSHTTRVEYFTAWDPAVGGTADLCDVAGVTPPLAKDDYIGRITYALGTINAGASKTVRIVYRRM